MGHALGPHVPLVGAANEEPLTKYHPTDLRYKDGTLRDIAEASDNLGIAALARPVEKWYLAWPRWV